MAKNNTSSSVTNRNGVNLALTSTLFKTLNENIDNYMFSTNGYTKKLGMVMQILDIK
jgi:hypothetical protein